MLAVLSIVLMLLDQRVPAVNAARSYIAAVVTPVQWLADIPASAYLWTDDRLRSRSGLIDENEKLKARNLVLEQKAQRLAIIAAENMRLRELLNSSALVDDKVLIAEIVGIHPDPYVHQVDVNKGSGDGVYMGQAVVDASGLVGQVVEVTPFSSRVLMVTDSTHALPVQVNRNGVRSIAAGIGKIDAMHLVHVPDTADIKEGDLLVSSGLGGRFPTGYPVAKVESVMHDPGRPFAEVIIRPTAALDRMRHVLLVFANKEEAETL